METPKVLSPQEIKELLILLRKSFQFFATLREEYPLAKHIKNIQIPSILSESIAFHLLQKSVLLPQLEGATLARNASVMQPDITAEKDGQVTHIEVKATSKNFQRFRKKDIAADYLIWISFADFFSHSEEVPVKIYALAKPGTYFTEVQEVQLDLFIRQGGENMQTTSYLLSTL